MSPPQASYKIVPDDLDDHIVANAISLALVSLDAERAEAILGRASEHNSFANLKYSLPIWSALRADDPDHPDAAGNYPYSFVREINGLVWRFERTRRKLLVIDFAIGGYSATLAAEAAVTFDQDVRGLSLKSVVVMNSAARIEEVRRARSNIHLRILTVNHSGRRGILLPKNEKWQVIPLPQISFGSSAVDFGWADDSLGLPIERFVGDIGGTGAEVPS